MTSFPVVMRCAPFIGWLCVSSGSLYGVRSDELLCSSLSVSLAGRGSSLFISAWQGVQLLARQLLQCFSTVSPLFTRQP